MAQKYKNNLKTGLLSTDKGVVLFYILCYIVIVFVVTVLLLYFYRMRLLLVLWTVSVNMLTESISVRCDCGFPVYK